MFGDDRKSEFKMAVVKTGSTYISACGGAGNAISNHNTRFSGSGNSVAPLPTLPHHKTKNIASGLFRDIQTTDGHTYYDAFRVQYYHATIS